jgi:hypothetical protein
LTKLFAFPFASFAIQIIREIMCNLRVIDFQSFMSTTHAINTLVGQPSSDMWKEYGVKHGIPESDMPTQIAREKVILSFLDESVAFVC